MPCYEPSRGEDRHNGDLAQMLCEAMKLIERQGLEVQLSPATREWWREHKARDSRFFGQR